MKDSEDEHDERYTARTDPAPTARLQRVLQRIPYSKSALYAMIRAGEFPKPVSLGANRVAWVEREIDDWIAALVTARDGAHTAPTQASHSMKRKIFPTAAVGFCRFYIFLRNRAHTSGLFCAAPARPAKTIGPGAKREQTGESAMKPIAMMLLLMLLAAYGGHSTTKESLEAVTPECRSGQSTVVRPIGVDTTTYRSEDGQVVRIRAACAGSATVFATYEGKDTHG